MKPSSMRWRTWLAVVALPLALGACGDDDPSDPDERDQNGTWSFTDDGRTHYVRITENSIEVFGNSGACFMEQEYEIQSVDGDVFTIDDGSGAVEWTIEEDDNTLVVEDEEGVSTTLTPSTANLSNLTMCEPFDPEVDDFVRPACTTLPLLAVPGSVTGDIEPGDARFYDASWIDLYRIQLTSETDVSLTMTADDQDDLDTYLSIYDATGTEVADDDDSADGSDSRVEVTLEAGCYYVVAGSYSGDDAGETGGGYTLTADDEFLFVFPPAACETLPEIAVGGSVNGRLQDGDELWSDGTWYDAYSLQLDAGRTVTITHSTTASEDVFDPYLLLFDALGINEIDDNDNIDAAGGNYNAQVTATLAPGCYIIVANSWSDPTGQFGGPGNYTLEVD